MVVLYLGRAIFLCGYVGWRMFPSVADCPQNQVPQWHNTDLLSHLYKIKWKEGLTTFFYKLQAAGTKWQLVVLAKFFSWQGSCHPASIASMWDWVLGSLLCGYNKFGIIERLEMTPVREPEMNGLMETMEGRMDGPKREGGIGPPPRRRLLVQLKVSR